jgi:hypothetical protein
VDFFSPSWCPALALFWNQPYERSQLHYGGELVWLMRVCLHDDNPRSFLTYAFLRLRSQINCNFYPYSEFYMVLCLIRFTQACSFSLEGNNGVEVG